MVPRVWPAFNHLGSFCFVSFFTISPICTLEAAERKAVGSKVTVTLCSHMSTGLAPPPADNVSSDLCPLHFRCLTKD